MNITNNYPAVTPTFKQISITANGQKAIDRIPNFNYMLKKEMEVANQQHPNTRYWNLVIDGEKEYDKHLKKFIYNPVCKYISKITGEVFEDLMIHPPTTKGTGEFHVCSSKNHKYLPSRLLLLDNKGLVSDEYKVKELVFDIKDAETANKIWEHNPDSVVGRDIYVYKALEEMSDKYESSLKIGVDEFLKTNPEFEEEINQIAKRDNAVWFSDGGVDQWT